MKLKEMGTDDRPRERLEAKGAEALGNSELLAILLRSGGAGTNVVELARNLLAKAGSLTGLSAMTLQEMREVKGIGRDKAITVAAAFELGRRFFAEMPPEKSDTPVTGSRQIFDVMYPLMKSLDHEECWMVYLSRSNRIIGKERISLGGRANTVMDPGLIIKKALDRKAMGLIMLHNHPSGNPEPGSADIARTKELKKATQMMGISLLDHIVIGNGCYYSFADEAVGLV